MGRFNSLLSGKCPKCEQGRVFDHTGNLLRFKGPKMNDTCPNCQHKFEREPGFFFGAMFISYGITLIEALGTYFIIRLLGLQLSVDAIMAIIVVVMVLTLFPNFRFSRMIWMYFFTRKSVQ